jgi:transcriptional regulator with XRE-family HTH domain
MDKNSFLKRLVEERKRRGCTQKQLADKLGVSDRTYSKWETGENEMDVSSLCRLAELYGESPAVFFPSDAPKTDGVRAELGALSPDDASRRWFRLHYDAIFGMEDAMYRYYSEHPGSPVRSLPPPPPPETPEPAAAVFFMPDLTALIASGKELNISLLLQPNADGWSWLKTDEELLRPYFRLLAMPGAISCFAVILSYPNDILLSCDHIASEAGVSPDEAAAALEEAASLKLMTAQSVLRGGTELRLYQSPDATSAVLLGMIALAKHFSRGVGFGHGCGMFGTGAPRITLKEKGEEKNE